MAIYTSKARRNLPTVQTPPALADERAGYDFTDGTWQALVEREMRPAVQLSKKALAALDAEDDDA